MKIAIVNIESLNVMHICGSSDPSSASLPWAYATDYTNPTPSHAHIVIPEGIDEDHLVVTLVSEQAHVPQYWSKEGETDVFTQPMLEDQPDESWANHPEVPFVAEHISLTENSVSKTAATKQADIQTLYNTMNADVYAEMETVFGTKNPESANAYKQTWDLMLVKPELFAGKLGLTTNQDVTNYATAKIATVEAYAVWRMERIETFQIAKAAILAG